ncbi:hypothetical protein J437_LFUL014777 [Ladona fulva]|uniref:Mitochondrial genome maintenance exonuclease 1 n=1 Tax=Ladona fulva TaxID=123851 RepID=A0A8K0P5Q1_LADFU|nr:hypothetical protein J437_LFUL014777 [Ladona fulva]
MALRKESESLLSGCCWLLKNFKRTCVSKTNYSLGRIIKDLNKENKALFGKLIETRKERRRNVLNNTCSASSGIQITNENVFPETGNLVTTQKSSTDLWPRAEVRVIKSSSTRLKEEIKHSSSLDTNVNESDKIHSEILLRNVSSSGDVCEPKSDAFNILKSIDKYPMMNQGKNVVPTFSLSDFDNSCISNKHISRIYPSVTKVLNATMSEHSKMLLKKWREKMIAELGQDGFMSFYKAQLNSGCQFHTAIQSFLRGTCSEDLLLDGQGVEGCWKSLTPVILKMKDVQILEGPIEGGLVVVAYSDGSAAETFHLDLPQCYSYWKLWLQRLKSFWNQYYECQSVQSDSQKFKEI